MEKFFSGFGLAALSFALVHDWYFTFDYVHVDIDKGTIRGFNSTAWRGTKYFTFKGIPYAKPPIGDLRFKAPEEGAAWTGVRDALRHGNVCPHLDMIFGVLRGEEDCLFLNVYTPSLEAVDLPVMVWIHGGGFGAGSANDEVYGPDYFMDAGVVLVTINYRLGALGFLSTGDDAAPGNAGMKDQVAALRWVRRNIARFGGDPENVTIFGESAGGAAVNFHLLSPMSAGLFSRAIGMSGSALNWWANSDNAAEFTIKLAETLGAKDVAGDTTRALKFLKAAPYEDVVRFQDTLETPEARLPPLTFLFVPSVEKNVKSEEVFLPASPLKILESGNFKKVPYIAGYNTHEGYVFHEELMKPEVRVRTTKFIERYVPLDIKNERLRIELGKSIRQFYFDDKPVHMENIANLFDFFTDSAFATGIDRATKLQLRSSKTPIYYYVFSYDGGLNLVKYFLNIKLPGAVHADDLGYLFNQKIMFWRTPAIGSEDEVVVNTMIRLWTNFAKFGNPTPPGDPLTWKPVTNEKFNYLNISGRDSYLAENPDAKRAKFWAKAYQKQHALTSAHDGRL